MAWTVLQHSGEAEISPDEGVTYERTFKMLSQEDSENLVLHIDPDAPLREENATLVEDDVRSEGALLRLVWQMVRAGRVAEAQQLCRLHKQFWRAASLGGGDIPDDPNLRSPARQGPPTGNHYRSLWKYSCQALATNSPNLYERATYGSLCQDLDSTLEGCRSWHDHLWAYLKVVVESAVDWELQSLQLNSLTRNPHIVFQYPQTPITLFSTPAREARARDVFDMLRKSSDIEISQGSREKFNIVQEDLVRANEDEDMFEGGTDPFAKLFTKICDWLLKKEEQAR